MIEGVLYLASVEIVAETLVAEQRIRAEMRVLRRKHGLDLRFSALESPKDHPRLLTIWDAGRPVTLTDLIEATDLLYGGEAGEKTPGSTPNAPGSTTGGFS